MSKGDKNRTADLEAYRSSPLWDNIGKDKKKHGPYVQIFRSEFIDGESESNNESESIDGRNPD